MAVYKIETNVTDEMIKEMGKHYFFLDDEIDKERFEGLKSLRKDPGVSSLEDYWELLEKISFITDGEYSIHNQGRYIELWN